MPLVRACLLALYVICPAFNLNAENTAVDANSTIVALKEQLAALAEKVSLLEHKNELLDEQSAQKVKENPRLSVSDKGLIFESADKNFKAQLRGLLQVDSRNFIDDGTVGTPGTTGTSWNNDGFYLRRARPIFQGTVYKIFDFVLSPEFGSGSPTATNNVNIVDAYINVAPWDEFQARAGKFKSPGGLENLQSDPLRMFAENSLVCNLLTNRDIGVDARGDIWDKTLSYEFGVFNGAPDQSGSTDISTSNLDDRYELAGRVFAHPFKKSGINEIKGLGLGIGGGIGDKGKNGNSQLTSGYVTDGQQKFFTYNTTTTSQSGDSYHIVPQAYWYYNNFGVLGEYAISSQDVVNGSRSASLYNTAWQVAGSWVITGENASYTGITPRNPFSLKNGTWGAFELVGRYSELKIDKDAFPVYAAAPNPTGAAAWGLGLNWYLNRNVRVTTDFFHTDFKGGNTTSPSSISAQDENVFITRLQLNF